MKRLLPVLFLLLSCSTARRLESNANEDNPNFLVTPYLQIGEHPSPDTIMVLWHAKILPDTNDIWTVQYQNDQDTIWKTCDTILKTKLIIKDQEVFNIYRTKLSALEAGSSFFYKIFKKGIQVFEAQGKALKAPDQPYRFVVSGDMGAGSRAAKQVALGIYKTNPDLVGIAGDIVYDNGLMSEYKNKWWPMYNSDKINMYGFPLMQSIPFFAVVGNHDTDSRNLNAQPDALAYFHFWDQPLNGPEGKEGGAYVPDLIANDKNRAAFMEGAGNRYPRMTNYSFNYGNAHWTVLDANFYVDWTNPELRDWVRQDLASPEAQDATWRFVMYHHPGISSSRAHYEDQQMRLVSNLFDSGKVDIVFAGHVHNYQRSFPMRINPDQWNISRRKISNDSWILDKLFDGNTNTRPNGIIYIVTGAGGQVLYNPEQQNDPSSWQKFTDKFISLIHSFSSIDINGKKLKFSQIGTDGAVLDSFEINKEEPILDLRN